MPRTVLVVDDSVFARRVLRDAFVGAGYRVVEAVNGRDAVDTFRGVHPDLVTMDIAMPGMSGIECLGLIREIDHDARVVMVSALNSDAVRSQSLSSGACAYVRKPFRPESLLDIVRKCLLSPPPR